MRRPILRNSSLSPRSDGTSEPSIIDFSFGYRCAWFNKSCLEWVKHDAQRPSIGRAVLGPGYQGTYGFWDWNVNFSDMSYPTVKSNPTAALVQGGAEIPGGEAGYGAVIGRKGIQEHFLFTGPRAGPFAFGPLVGASTANGPNPLDNVRYIGLFGEASNHWLPGTGSVGPQAAIGGGVFT